jgi:hypothetical protein
MTIPYKEKMRMHQLYKQLKVGLVQWEDISPEDKIVLQRFYGIDKNGFW